MMLQIDEKNTFPRSSPPRPYLEVVRAFGLRVGRTLTRADGMLVKPRSAREIADDKVVQCPSASTLAEALWQIPRSVRLGAGTIAD